MLHSDFAPLTYPQPAKRPILYPGDKIAIITPATEVRSDYIDGAVCYLRRRGYNPVVMPNARGPRCGSFAASDARRLDDLTAALLDDDTRLIFCSRGGYGCIHLLDKVNPEIIAQKNKMLLGFSDISVLHALWQAAGVYSLHASMAKQLTERADAPETDDIMALLEGRIATPDKPYTISNGKYNLIFGGENLESDAADSQHIIARGIVTGGNLAVLNGLAATPWDTLSPDNLRGRILLLEDVGEKIYCVERMLTRLHLAGALDAPEAIIFGQFTDYQPDRNFDYMEQMIEHRLHQWHIKTPVILNMPVGHTDHNAPLPLGLHALLTMR